MNRSVLTQVYADPLSDLQPPPSRHLIHQSGCPLYVWWAVGKRRNADGERWHCWFVYLEYRQADGRSGYRQLQLPLSDSCDPSLWQRLSQLDLTEACDAASRANLIGRG